MKVTDFEEAEGLTAEKVREYLEKRWHLSGGRWYLRDGNQMSFIGGRIDEEAVLFIADIERRTVQAVLRDINPRLRKGVPSPEAIAAHHGLWIGHMGGKFPLVCIGVWVDGGFLSGSLVWSQSAVQTAATDEHPCAFWPCDSHGARVPWPAGAP